MSIVALPPGDRLGQARAWMAAAYGRLSSRERWMLVGLGIAALAVAAVASNRWAGGERDRYAAAQADLMVARQNRAAIQRGLDAFDYAQLHALSSWSEHGRSIWLVRVRIEQRIVSAAMAAGLTAPDVQVAEAVEGDSAVPLLRADVNTPDQGAAVASLLRRLSDDQEAFVLDRVQLTTGDAPGVKLSLLFPVQLDQGAPAS